MEDKQLKEKTARGLLWGGLGNGAMQVLNLAFGILLSRLLSPADYGVVGSLLIFYAVAGIFSDSGFILAIVNRREAGAREYNAVFRFNVVVSLSLYAVLFCCAPLIARFYRQPDMVWLARFLFLTYVFGAVASAPTAYYFRNLMVKERSRIQIEAITVSGTVGVVCAFCGMGYWGLAVQTVLYSAMNSVLLWWRCPWRPTFGRVAVWPVLRDMLPFSMKQMAVALFQQVNNNMFSMLLGRFYGMRVTGFYTQGSKWTVMGYTTLTGMINSVGQPVLRQTVDERARTVRVFRKLLRFTAFVSFPAMLGLGIVARELIVITVTAKWLDSVPVMQILCVGGAFMPLSILYGNLFNSIGRPGIYMWNTISLGALQLAALLVTCRFSLGVMLAVYVALNVGWLAVWQLYARRHTGVRFRDVLRDTVPYLAVSAVAMAAALWAGGGIANPVLSMAVKIAVAAAVYVLLMWRLRSVVFAEAVEFLKSRIHKKQ